MRNVTVTGMNKFPYNLSEIVTIALISIYLRLYERHVLIFVLALNFAARGEQNEAEEE